jgi:hypothetical protein
LAFLGRIKTKSKYTLNKETQLTLSSSLLGHLVTNFTTCIDEENGIYSASQLDVNIKDFNSER